MTQEKQRTFTNEITAKEFLLDLTLMLKDFYIAKFINEEERVSIVLLNGQKFELILQECT